MKNKILIGIAVVLILIVLLVRYIFKDKFESFKTSISHYEIDQLSNFRKEKEKRVAELINGDKIIYESFTNQFDESKSMAERDTSFSFLYLSKDLKYNIASLNYIDCLNNKCIIDKENGINQKLISIKEKEYGKKYGQTFSIWYPKLKNDKLLKKVNISGDCIGYFPNIEAFSLNSNAWNDFEKFMISYNNVIKQTDIQNRQIFNQYLSRVSSTKNQLRSSTMDLFDDKLSNKKSQILKTEIESKEYNSPTLGLITYNVNKTNFDKQAFQNIADQVFEEQWKSNSLRTGEMPYSNCYGASNYCGSFYCSEIRVKTGGADVLVTIKDRNRNVVRHGYINTGHTYTFHLSDGEYQVFFYSGSGWNPNKFMKSTYCGDLYGGFVSGENVTKDKYISIHSQIMTYELILQRDGNLSTKPSSKDEAF